MKPKIVQRAAYYSFVSCRTCWYSDLTAILISSVTGSFKNSVGPTMAGKVQNSSLLDALMVWLLYSSCWMMDDCIISSCGLHASDTGSNPTVLQTTLRAAARHFNIHLCHILRPYTYHMPHTATINLYHMPHTATINLSYASCCDHAPILYLILPPYTTYTMPHTATLHLSYGSYCDHIPRSYAS